MGKEPKIFKKLGKLLPVLKYLWVLQPTISEDDVTVYRDTIRIYTELCDNPNDFSFSAHRTIGNILLPYKGIKLTHYWVDKRGFLDIRFTYDSKKKE